MTNTWPISTSTYDNPTSLKLRGTKRVFVGISGGVDSAVTALLLRQDGYEVTGVFIRGYEPDWLPCSWRDERRDAMRVCLALDIPFLFLDLEREYKEAVVDEMLREYKSGRTPNPDVLCNREIKFGIFWEKARALGADLIATGHYLSGEKDQSYFLWTLTNTDLDHVMFPVGHMDKREVRKIAKKYALPVADKKDSQGICFLGQVSMDDFLSHFITSTPGKVLNTRGEEIGIHKGLIYYTIGERHGFEVENKANNSSPFYVVAKDFEQNALIVSDNESEIISLSPKNISITNVNLRGEPRGNLTAQVRYRGERLVVKLTGQSPALTKGEVRFEKPVRGLSLGQSIVFYQDEKCIGGAVMDKIIS